MARNFRKMEDPSSHNKVSFSELTSGKKKKDTNALLENTRDSIKQHGYPLELKLNRLDERGSTKRTSSLTDIIIRSISSMQALAYRVMNYIITKEGV